jgi:hypothetical protein
MHYPRLEEPNFTLFSEPPMTQQEQLSYLVLGRSLQEAPEGESSALAQASLALGVKGGNFLAENIGGNLGVDEFTIRSGSGEAGAESDPSDAALVIGKYLSPKLYLSYGVGLFNPVSVLTMQYRVEQRRHRRRPRLHLRTRRMIATTARTYATSEGMRDADGDAVVDNMYELGLSGLQKRNR